MECVFLTLSMTTIGYLFGLFVGSQLTKVCINKKLEETNKEPEKQSE